MSATRTNFMINPLTMDREAKLKTNKWASIATVIIVLIAIIIAIVGIYAQKQHDKTVDADGNSSWKGFLKFKDVYILIALILALLAGIWSWFSSIKLSTEKTA